MGSVSRRHDRFTLTYTFLTLLLFVFIAFGSELDRAFNLSLLLVPLLLLPAVLVLCLLSFVFVLNVIDRRWRHALSALLAPVLAAVPLLVCYMLDVTPQRVRFAFERARFEREVAQFEREPGVPRLIAFAAGGIGGAGTANVKFVLLYDESDEIRLPLSQRSMAWRERAGRVNQLSSVATGRDDPAVHSLGGHFYELAFVL